MCSCWIPVVTNHYQVSSERSALIATTTGHGAIAATASLAATIGAFGANAWTITIGALLAAYTAHHSMKPDIIGMIGGSAVGDYELYVRAHEGDIAAQHAKLPD